MQALPPPPGGDQNRAPALLAVFWAPFPLTMALVSLRLFVRISMKSLGIDDYLMFLSWIIYTASLGIASNQIVHGGAQHLFYLMPNQISNVVKLNTIGIPFGIMASALGKSSVAVFILRLMGPATVWQKWFLYISIGLYMIVSVLDSIFTFAQCSPPKALWETIPDKKCWNREIYVNFSIFQSSFGVFVDFYLALLPVTIIWKLNLSLKKRIGLCLLLGMGVFAGVCAAIKTKDLSGFGNQADLTWATYAAFIWAPLEIALVIICGSIPAVKPLYDWLVTGKPLGPKKNSRYPNRSSYIKRKDSPTQYGNTRLVGNSTNIITASEGTRGSSSENSPYVGSNHIGIEHSFDINLDNLDHQVSAGVSKSASDSTPNYIMV